MTEKLYYTDGFIFDFEAKVVKIVNTDSYCAVILDKTAFFPLGGGQMPDTGYIGDNYVYDVQEVDGEIYHYIKIFSDLHSDEVVFCRVDKSKRFARMQAHSGEHIVSGIVHSMFNADNVGFHMDDTLMTVDFNKYLSKEELAEVEMKANECVYADVPIKTYIVSASEGDDIDYRSKLEFNGDVRLVEIEGTDVCACCAPHVRSTGQVGLIKILSSVSHRGGVRITLVCGITAYEDYFMKHNATVNISTALCAKHNETDSAVYRLIEANKELEYSLLQNKRKYLKMIADDIEAMDVLFRIYSELNMDELRELCNLTKSKCKMLSAFFSGNDESGYSYCIYSEMLDLSLLVKDFNKALNGSGGGRGELVQGKIKCSAQVIYNFLKTLRVDDYENEKKKES